MLPYFKFAFDLHRFLLENIAAITFTNL